MGYLLFALPLSLNGQSISGDCVCGELAETWCSQINNRMGSASGDLSEDRWCAGSNAMALDEHTVSHLKWFHLDTLLLRHISGATSISIVISRHTNHSVIEGALVLP